MKIYLLTMLEVYNRSFSMLNAEPCLQILLVPTEIIECLNLKKLLLRTQHVSHKEQSLPAMSKNHECKQISREVSVTCAQFESQSEYVNEYKRLLKLTRWKSSRYLQKDRHENRYFNNTLLLRKQHVYITRITNFFMIRETKRCLF